jgi:N-acyl homoserine lactone hydrolase
MKPRTRLAVLASLFTLAVAVAGGAGATRVSASTHPTQPAALGVTKSARELDALVAIPGPLTVETVVAAQWEVERGGLIDLDHPRAKAAGLVDGPEPIEIYFHAVRHPTRGLFLVDAGVERAMLRDPEHALFHGLVGRVMHVDKLRVTADTATWLERQGEPLAGVFLTHMHLDHIAGMTDVPASTPVFTGPGEATWRGALNLFTQSITDRALAGKGPIRELAFERDESGAFDGVLDVFGDGSFWALWVPGHTPGSTAYLARTPRGPVLFTGDACHTAWGWEHDVEPGGFTRDRAENARTLAQLRAFVAKHPEVDVRLGHQRLDGVRRAS